MHDASLTICLSCSFIAKLSLKIDDSYNFDQLYSKRESKSHALGVTHLDASTLFASISEDAKILFLLFSLLSTLNLRTNCATMC